MWTESELFRLLPFYHFYVWNYKSSRQTFQKMSEWGNCWHLRDQRCVTCHFCVHQEVFGSLGSIQNVLPTFCKWPILSWRSVNTEMHLLISMQTWLSAELAEERCSLLLSVSQKPLTPDLRAPLLICESHARAPWCEQLTGAFIPILMLVCAIFFPLW